MAFRTLIKHAFPTPFALRPRNTMSILKVAYEELKTAEITSDNLQDGGRYPEREQFLVGGTRDEIQETLYSADRLSQRRRQQQSTLHGRNTTRRLSFERHSFSPFASSP